MSEYWKLREESGDGGMNPWHAFWLGVLTPIVAVSAPLGFLLILLDIRDALRRRRRRNGCV